MVKREMMKMIQGFNLNEWLKSGRLVAAFFVPAFALLVSGALSMPTHAQTKTTRSTGTKRRPVRTAPPPPVDMRPQAQLVAEQITILSRFVFVYGKVVNTLEVARDKAQQNQTSAEIEARNRQSVGKLVRGIRGLADGIDNLAMTFKAEDRLQIQYLKIAAAKDAVAEASQMAAADKFEEAGTSLIVAIERLTETIISMKLP
jgi:hypothetical protein